MDDPNTIFIPKERTPDTIVKNLTYFLEDEFVHNGSQSSPLFGGHQSWLQREESFKLNSNMKVKLNFLCAVVIFYSFISYWFFQPKKKKGLLAFKSSCFNFPS